MPSLILHSLLLTLSIIFAFAWTNDQNLNPYTLQLIGSIVIFYFILKISLRQHTSITKILDVLVFTSLISFIIFSTGSLHSPIFLLFYFLLFSISLLFEPSQSIFISLLLSILLIWNSNFAFDNVSFVNLATLLLITPIAHIFGKKYLEILEANGRIQILNHTLAEKESDTLIWLATEAKPSLVNFLDTTSLIISSNLLPFGLQQKLKNLHEDLINLHQSANILEDDMDEKNND